jgi:hypothetical protein
MKNIIQIILISFFTFTIISCAKESGSSKSSTPTPMSTPSVSDGNYKLTAAIAGLYYSDGTHYMTYTFSISHDSSVTPGYLAYVLEWKGSGIYRVTTKGKATLSTNGGIDDATLDCTTNGIVDVTLDTDGNVTNETIIQTGCGGSSTSLSDVSDKFTVISGGFQQYSVLKDSSSNQYRIFSNFQKQ